MYPSNSCGKITQVSRYQRVLPKLFPAFTRYSYKLETTNLKLQCNGDFNEKNTVRNAMGISMTTIPGAEWAYNGNGQRVYGQRRRPQRQGHSRSCQRDPPAHDATPSYPSRPCSEGIVFPRDAEMDDDRVVVLLTCDADGVFCGRWCWLADRSRKPEPSRNRVSVDSGATSTLKQ